MMRAGVNHRGENTETLPQAVEALPSLRFRGILGAMMGNELWDTLMRFHHEVAKPEIIGDLSDRIGSLRREMLSGFDAVYRRLDRLESEYQSRRCSR